MLIALVKNLHIDTETKYIYDYIHKNCNFNGRRVMRSSSDPLSFLQERKGKVLPTLLCCCILVRALSISQELLGIGHFTPLCRLQHLRSSILTQDIKATLTEHAVQKGMIYANSNWTFSVESDHVFPIHM